MAGFGKGGGKTLNVQIEGMSCDHCAARLKEALEALSGVSGAKVELGKKRARVSTHRAGSAEQAAEVKDAIRQKIKELGYQAVGID